MNGMIEERAVRFFFTLLVLHGVCRLGYYYLGGYIHRAAQFCFDGMVQTTWMCTADGLTSCFFFFLARVMAGETVAKGGVALYITYILHG